MINLEELPPIEGGTPKQQIYAEGIRLRYIQFVECELDPKLYAAATIVLQIRVDYKWWIDKAKKVDEKSIKTMGASAKAAITRAGSVEKAIQAQRDSIQKQNEKYQEYLKYLSSSGDSYIYDQDEHGGRERPF